MHILILVEGRQKPVCDRGLIWNAALRAIWAQTVPECALSDVLSFKSLKWSIFNVIHITRVIFGIEYYE